MAMTLEYAQTEALMKLIKENTEALRENTLMMEQMATDTRQLSYKVSDNTDAAEQWAAHRRGDRERVIKVGWLTVKVR